MRRLLTIAALFCCAPAHAGEMVRSIVEFGALADGVTDNAGSIQSAIDSFKGQTQNASATTKGVVLIPAAAKPYRIGRTIWLDVPNVELRGEGWGSRIQMHPSMRHNVLQLGVRRTETLGGRDVVVTDAHRPDAFGILDATACPRPGARRGIRTLRDSYVHLQAGPFDQGCGSGSGDWYADGWGETMQLTVEWCATPGEGETLPPNVPLFGSGNAGGASWEPSPLLVWTGPTGKEAKVTFRTHGQDPYANGSFRGFTFPIGKRNAFTIDLAAGTVAAWADGVQVPIAGRFKLDELVGTILAQNDYHPFLIGSFGARGHAGQASTPVDLTLYGLRYSRGPRYQNLGPGQPQTPLTGKLNDATAYFGNDPQTVAFLPLQDAPPPSRVVGWFAGNASFYGPGSGYLMSTANSGGIIGNAVRDLSITAGAGFGQAISLGAVLDTEISRVATRGGFNGVGSWNMLASYTVQLDHCDLDGVGSAYYGFMQLLWARNVNIQTAGRVTIRHVGCSANWDNVFVRFATKVSESFARTHARDYGGAYVFENINVDFEGPRFRRSGITAEAHPYTPASSLRLRDVFFGTVGPEKPLVELIDVGPGKPYAVSSFTAEGLAAWQPFGAAVRTTGPLWRGSVRGSPGLGEATVEHTGRWGETCNVEVGEHQCKFAE